MIMYIMYIKPSTCKLYGVILNFEWSFGKTLHTEYWQIILFEIYFCEYSKLLKH